MNKGTIIFLNGVSSSGKSTLARELVKNLPDFFHLGIDDFDILIDRMEDRPNNRLIPVETGYFFHRTIAVFSSKGVNLIVDHILHDRATEEDCLAVLNGYPVLFVGVHCPAEELDRREGARGDRSPGQGRKQLHYVHQNEVYDIEVDTFSEGVERSSERLIEALRGGHYPAGWLRTVDRMGHI